MSIKRAFWAALWSESVFADDHKIKDGVIFLRYGQGAWIAIETKVVAGLVRSTPFKGTMQAEVIQYSCGKIGLGLLYGAAIETDVEYVKNFICWDCIERLEAKAGITQNP